jgi:hypothetical protein
MFGIYKIVRPTTKVGKRIGNELRFSINGGLVKMEVEGQYCLYMNFNNVASVSCREIQFGSTGSQRWNSR